MSIRWLASDDKKLKKLYRSGKSIKEIADLTPYSISSVRLRLHELFPAGLRGQGGDHHTSWAIELTAEDLPLSGKEIAKKYKITAGYAYHLKSAYRRSHSGKNKD